MRDNSGAAAVKLGIRRMEAATQLGVHDELRPTELADRVINFNYGSNGSHIVDQHGVIIDSIPQQSGVGRAERLDGNGGILGTPKDFSHIRMPGLDLAQREAGIMASVTAHELSHTVNVHHHGEGDYPVTWQDAMVNGAQVVAEDGTPISVHDEANSDLLNPRKLSLPMTIQIGSQNGPHAGAEECYMPYSGKPAYISQSTPGLRYLPGFETAGAVLCTSPAGTGINASGRQPQSR